MKSSDSSRYEGRPFLKFLEAYVLSSIGHLEQDEEEALNQLTPVLAGALAINGSWSDIVASHMDFPPNLPGKIKQIWDDGVIRAHVLSFNVDPMEFTRQFVDTNFPDDADNPPLAS